MQLVKEKGACVFFIIFLAKNHKSQHFPCWRILYSSFNASIDYNLKSSWWQFYIRYLPLIVAFVSFLITISKFSKKHALNKKQEGILYHLYFVRIYPQSPCLEYNFVSLVIVGLLSLDGISNFKKASSTYWCWWRTRWLRRQSIFWFH